MTVFVLDASVTMRWFFDAGSHSLADDVLTGLATSGNEAVVPMLWRYEVSAVLVRAQSKAGIAADDVAHFFEDLAGLPIRIDPESGSRIFSDVHRLAVTHRLTSYDAAYLEVALRLNLPMATLDAELAAACGRADVRLL